MKLTYNFLLLLCRFDCISLAGGLKKFFALLHIAMEKPDMRAVRFIRSSYV